MVGLGHHGIGRAGFDNLARVHHTNVVGQAGHHGQVVGDPDKGGARVACQAPHFGQNLALDGHIQRGGTPSAFDRVLATRFGLQAITAASEGDWGKMVALHGTDIVRVPLATATEKLKTVPIERYKESEIFFG